MSLVVSNQNKLDRIALKRIKRGAECGVLQCNLGCSAGGRGAVRRHGGRRHWPPAPSASARSPHLRLSTTHLHADFAAERLGPVPSASEPPPGLGGRSGGALSVEAQRGAWPPGLAPQGMGSSVTSSSTWQHQQPAATWICPGHCSPRWTPTSHAAQHICPVALPASTQTCPLGPPLKTRLWGLQTWLVSP